MTDLITFDEVKGFWKDNIDPCMLYIHSAFCLTNCTYCVYRGTKVDTFYKDYFSNYLPSRFDAYKEIIDKQKFQCIYFGGGTANIEPDLKNLEPMFERTRNLKCNEKVIELHFGINITDETIQKVIDEKFTTVILCIQTFNAELLEKYNRYNNSSNDIDYIIGKLHSAGIKVGIDLLQFIGENKNILTDDLKKLNGLKNMPDEISIAPIYNKKSKNTSSNYLNFIDSICSSGVKNCYHPEFEFDQNNYSHVKVMRFYKKSINQYEIKNRVRYYKDFYSFICYLDEWNGNHYYSTLGIGSYKNQDKNTYSHVGKYTYNEDFDGEKTEYHLLKSLSFYDKCRALINWMEAVSNGREPSSDTRIELVNNYDNSASTDLQDKMCYFNINSSNEELIKTLNSTCGDRDKDILKYLDTEGY